MDIQALFEQNSVPEIQAKLEEIRHSIEKEREELRIMVSERYRDLIEAADSIVEMQKRAEQICQRVKNVESGCGQLQHQGLIGFRGRDDADIARQERKRRLYDVGARVKLLMDMPETLWLRVERKQMLTAALLHMLAQYIYTGLQVEGQSVRKQFPVVLRQWTAIQRFRATILSGCHAAVRAAELQQTEAVVSALVAVALLEGTAARSALSLLLRERAEAALAALRPDAVEDSVARQAARATRLILHTLQLVYALFCGENALSPAPEGQFTARMREVMASQKPFELVDDRGSVAMRHLSADIRNYIPAVSSPEPQLTAADVRQLVGSWLQQLAHQLRPKVVQLLEGVPTVKGLASVRDGVYSVLAEDQHRPHWTSICQTVAGEQTCLWQLFLREAVVTRADQHIRHSLSSAFGGLTESLTQAVEDQERLKPAVDIVDFRWSDVSEVPSTSGWMNYRNRSQPTLPGLVLRSRGHATQLQQVCGALDGGLERLLADVATFTERPELPAPLSPPFDKWADNHRLAEAMRAETQQQLTSLLSTLEDLAGSAAAAEDAAVLLARAPRGLADLCPHVPLCLDSGGNGRQPGSSRRSLWEELSQQLLAVRPRLLHGWCQTHAQRLGRELADSLRTAGDVNLDDFALWAAVTITEEGDSGQTLESVVRVPRCPRLSLTAALYRLSTQLNRLGSMTLGREVQAQLVQACVRRLVEAYSSHLAAPPAPISQHQALQALFDVHFLRGLASARDQELSKKISATCETIEEHIDPFDLNVCWPHALKNLRVFTQQSQLSARQSLLGALSVDRGPARALGAAGGGQQEPHSLLPLSETPVRFSLLAVPDPTPLDRPRPPPTAKAAPAGSPKKAETIKASPSFLAGLSASWF